MRREALAQGGLWVAGPARRWQLPEGWVRAAALVVVGALVLLPVGWLVAISLRPSMLQSGVTWKWYAYILQDAALWQRFWLTVLVSAATTLFCLVVGLPIAWFVARTDMPLAGFMESISILPFALPPLIGALAWSNLLAPRTGLLNMLLRQVLNLPTDSGPINLYSVWGIAFVMGLYYSPYVIQFAAAALKSMDSSLEEAARVFGANSLSTARRVTLPLILPAIVSSALLAFIFAAGQFTIPTLLGVPAGIYLYTTTIYQKMKLWPPNEPLATALGMVLVGLIAALTWLRRRMLARGSFTTVTGKGFRPAVVRLGALRWPAALFCLGYMGVAVVLPMLSLLYGSVLSYWRPTWRLEDFTLRNYAVLLRQPLTWHALKNSLALSVGGSTVAMALATVVAFLTVRARDGASRLLSYLSMLPAAVPGVVFGVGVLVAFIRPPLVLYGTIWILLVGYISHFLPVAVNAASSSLMQVHPELEESARLFGAGFLQTLWRVTVPLILPGILAGWVSLVIIFLRELAISVFVYSPGSEVLAVQLFELWNDGRVSVASALSVILAIITWALVVALRAAGRGRGAQPVSG